MVLEHHLSALLCPVDDHADAARAVAGVRVLPAEILVDVIRAAVPHVVTRAEDAARLVRESVEDLGSVIRRYPVKCLTYGARLREPRLEAVLIGGTALMV